VPEYGRRIPTLIADVAPIEKRVGTKLLAATRPVVAAAPVMKFRRDLLFLLIDKKLSFLAIGFAFWLSFFDYPTL
jgi:hypothetical protein